MLGISRVVGFVGWDHRKDGCGQQRAPPHTPCSTQEEMKAVTLPAATAGPIYMQLQKKNIDLNCTKSSTILTWNEEKLLCSNIPFHWVNTYFAGPLAGAWLIHKGKQNKRETWIEHNQNSNFCQICMNIPECSQQCWSANGRNADIIILVSSNVKLFQPWSCLLIQKYMKDSFYCPQSSSEHAPPHPR